MKLDDTFGERSEGGEEDEGDEEDEEDEEDEKDEEEDGVTGDEPLAASPTPEPRVREDLEDERPQISTGGFGSAVRRFEFASILPRGGIGSGRTGLGSSAANQGPGPKDDTAHEAVTSSFPSHTGIVGEKERSVPDATDAAPRHPQRSFVRNGSGSAGSTPGSGTPKLSQEERMHFSKLQGSFGAKLMAKMGWQAVSWPLLICPFLTNARELVWEPLGRGSSHP